MLVWKNQNPWTALRGGFYDYYLDYTGGYFGYKHGAAPLHIQLNLNDSLVCVVNQTALKTDNLTASVRLYDLHGKLISETKSPVTLEAQNVLLLNKIELPKNSGGIFFLKLQLINNDKVVDENLYWLSNKPHSYEKLNDLGKVTVKTEIKKGADGRAVVEISNPNNETAFFIRLKVLKPDNELLLPSFFTDNYFTLLPGDKKQVDVDYNSNKSTVGLNELKLSVEGWNLIPEEIKF
jgi:hypothetical protein